MQNRGNKFNEKKSISFIVEVAEMFGVKTKLFTQKSLRQRFYPIWSSSHKRIKKLAFLATET
jgi:hypothetical protein